MAPPLKSPPPEEAPELFANGDANSGPFKLMVRVVVVVVVVICHLQTGHPNCHRKGFRRSLHQTAHQMRHLSQDLGCKVNTPADPRNTYESWQMSQKNSTSGYLKPFFELLGGSKNSRRQIILSEIKTAPEWT